MFSIKVKRPAKAVDLLLITDHL